MSSVGAFTVIGLPPAVSTEARTLPAFGSMAAVSVNTTSAEVNGVPSDHATPGRRCSVCTSPSGLESHLSASHGSSSKVALLTRTRRDCMSSDSSSADWLPVTTRLNDRGSLRTETTNWPPRRASACPGDPLGARPDRTSQIRAKTLMSVREIPSRLVRRKRILGYPGQVLGRSEKRVQTLKLPCKCAVRLRPSLRYPTLRPRLVNALAMAAYRRVPVQSPLTLL